MQLRFLLLDGKDGIRIGPFGSSIKIEHLVSEGIKVYGQENVIYRDFEAGDRRITEGHFCELSEYEIRGGDVLVTMAGTAGRCQAVPDRVEKGIIDSHLVRMRFPTEGVHAPFIPHLIESAAYVVAQIQVAWRGTTMQGLNSTIIKHLAIAIPGLDEQRAIFSFLDRETAKIDALIAEQQRLIELLQEKRQAVISHAVTKGLNPDAPMKNSGIEWLGEVPEHWDVMPVKYLVASIEQGWSPQCDGFPVQDESEWGVLKVGCVNGGVFNPQENKSLPPELSPIPKLGIASGDLLVSRANTRDLVGSAAVADRDYPRLLLCDKVYRLRLDRHRCSPTFLSLFLASRAAREPIELGATGASASMVNIGQSVILNLIAGVPPVAEQCAVVQHVADMLTRLSALETEAHHAVAVLQERRSALISAAVTGQIDIRNYTSEGAAA
jgi:type I restriction enzyme S subunit